MPKNKQNDGAQDTTEQVDVPEATTTQPEGNAAEERGKYLRMLDKNKDFAKQFGQPDFASLLSRVGSDGVFAQQVLMAALNNDAEKPQTHVLPDAPQENNIVGVLDNTGDVATKVKTDGQAENPATTAVN